MADANDRNTQPALNADELDAEQALELPEREAMTLIDTSMAGGALPVDGPLPTDPAPAPDGTMPMSTNPVPPDSQSLLGQGGPLAGKLPASPLAE